MNPVTFGFNTCFLLLGITAIIGNSLVLAVVAKYRKTLLVTDCFDLIAALAIADFITGMITIFRQTKFFLATDDLLGLGSFIAGIERFRVDIFETNFTKAECLVTTTPMIFGMTSGQIILIFVCFDRIYATLKPLQYTVSIHETFTKIAAIVTIGCSVISVS